MTKEEEKEFVVAGEKGDVTRLLEIITMTNIDINVKDEVSNVILMD